MQLISRTEVEGALGAAGLDWERLETADGSWALVVPELGAKVLAAGVDQESLFWVNPILERGAWCVGGQRTWLAPELGARGFFGTAAEDWSVPPALDPGRYRRITGLEGERVYRSDLVIDRLDGRSYTLGIVRAVQIDSAVPPMPGVSKRRGLKIAVETRLVNRTDRTLEQEVGLWSIVQAPAETTGTFLIPLTSSARQGEDSYRLYFGDLPPDWMAASPTLLTVKARAGRWWKIGVPPGRSTGAVGYLRPSRIDDGHLLVILRTDVEPAGCYLDKPPAGAAGNGDFLQCYNSPDREAADFCELEVHAPALRLAPEEEQCTRVEIHLFKGGRESLCAVAGRLTQVRIEPGLLYSNP